MTRATKNKMKMAVVGSIPQMVCPFHSSFACSIPPGPAWFREPLEQSDQLLWIHFLEEKIGGRGRSISGRLQDRGQHRDGFQKSREHVGHGINWGSQASAGGKQIPHCTPFLGYSIQGGKTELASPSYFGSKGAEQGVQHLGKCRFGPKPRCTFGPRCSSQ